MSSDAASSRKKRHPVEPGPDPDELARGAELVELLGAVVGHPPGQHLPFPERHRKREPLQRDERLTQRRAAIDAVPAREEAAQRGLLHGLDLAPQGRERGPAQPPKDVRIAPLSLAAARAQLAPHELLLALEPPKLLLDLDAEPGRHLRGGERPAAACPTRDEGAQRVGHRLEEHGGQARRRHDAERVAVAARILGGGEPLLPGDPDANGAPFRLEDRGVGLVELASAQVASQAQQVIQPLGILRERAQRRLDLGERGRVDQLAQLLLAEQLPQKVPVERQRLSAPLRGGASPYVAM